MIRCPHSVYDPSGTGKSEYCSLCTTLQPLPEGQTVLHPLREEQVHGCPKCKSPRFRHHNQWDFHCPECGFDALEG